MCEAKRARCSGGTRPLGKCSQGLPHNDLCVDGFMCLGRGRHNGNLMLRETDTHRRASSKRPASPCCTTVLTSPPAQKAFSPAPCTRRQAMTVWKGCHWATRSQQRLSSCNSRLVDGSVGAHAASRKAAAPCNNAMLHEMPHAGRWCSGLTLSTMQATAGSASHFEYTSYMRSTMVVLRALRARGRLRVATSACRSTRART